MTQTMTMRELPATERPYEKCLEYGPGALTNAELLAVILRNGTGSLTALQLAISLLKQYEGSNPLSRISSAPVEALTEVHGIGRVKAIQLQCIGELAARIHREPVVGMLLNSPDSIAAYFMEEMRHLDHEELRAVFFDTKGHLLRWVRLTSGTVNASPVTPREVYCAALNHRAVYLVLIHNHPSGDPEPSAEDISVSRRLQQAGEILDVKLMDHIIIGDRRYISLKMRGLL